MLLPRKKSREEILRENQKLLADYEAYMQRWLDNVRADRKIEDDRA